MRLYLVVIDGRPWIFQAFSIFGAFVKARRQFPDAGVIADTHN